MCHAHDLSPVLATSTLLCWLPIDEMLALHSELLTCPWWWLVGNKKVFPDRPWWVGYEKEKTRLILENGVRNRTKR
jgi:hypothetical protein